MSVLKFEKHTARSLVEDVKPTDETDSGCEAHDRGETAATDMRRAHTLHNPKGKGRNGGRASANSIVGGTSISEYTPQMPRYMVSLVQKVVGAGRTGRNR
jgi:hypothetical protein